MRRCIATLIFLVKISGGASAEELRHDWRLEDGAEYDSNPARAERISGVAP